ncbi:MAG: hypothetical protein P4M00_21250 [Azospirillaceae bacterium]|nr:hypothetical protein [Azospirillaceae bacterium]
MPPLKGDPGMSSRSCASCTLCCKLMGVPELKKPAARWCSDCDQAQGCTVYERRPPSCRNFACFWLMDDQFPDEMRPDRIHALLAFNDTPDSVVLHVDPAHPAAVRSAEVSALIDALLKNYQKLFVLMGRHSAMLTPSRWQQSQETIWGMDQPAAPSPPQRPVHQQKRG